MIVPGVLRTLDDEDRRLVLAACAQRTYEPGSFVFHEGAEADALHMIVAGRFAVRARRPDGDAAMLTVLGPGDVFGEVGLVAEAQRRTAAVTALGRGQTAALERDRFHALCHARPQVRKMVEQALADHVDRLTGLLSEALYVDADTRVLRRLSALAALYRRDGGAGPVVVELSQAELAELAGTSRATVNRVLRVQERLGTIRLGRGRVHVLDPGAPP